jgi:hypothetical protein
MRKLLAAVKEALTNASRVLATARKTAPRHAKLAYAVTGFAAAAAIMTALFNGKVGLSIAATSAVLILAVVPILLESYKRSKDLFVQFLARVMITSSLLLFIGGTWLGLCSVFFKYPSLDIHKAVFGEQPVAVFDPLAAGKALMEEAHNTFLTLVNESAPIANKMSELQNLIKNHERVRSVITSDIANTSGFPEPYMNVILHYRLAIVNYELAATEMYMANRTLQATLKKGHRDRAEGYAAGVLESITNANQAYDDIVDHAQKRTLNGAHGRYPTSYTELITRGISDKLLWYETAGHAIMAILGKGDLEQVRAEIMTLEEKFPGKNNPREDETMRSIMEIPTVKTAGPCCDGPDHRFRKNFGTERVVRMTTLREGSIIRSSRTSFTVLASPARLGLPVVLDRPGPRKLA